MASFTLQKVDQYILYYEKCNEMVKKAMRKTKDMVLPGMICGYKDVGKDSCQVSARTLSHLGRQVVTTELPHSRVGGAWAIYSLLLAPLLKGMPGRTPLPGGPPGCGEDGDREC